MGKAITRLGDKSLGHCFESRGNVAGSPNVFIDGIAAHRIGDAWPTHTCKTKSHSSITVIGSGSVFVNGVALARIGDGLDCGDTIAEGSPNVFSGG